MRRLTLAVVVAILTTLLHVSGPAAQPALIAGGLTALPSTNLGPNLLQNAGFETLNAGLPSGWTAGAGWSADQLVAHSGTASYRRTTGASTSSQRLQLRAGTYLVSAWIKTENLGSGSSSGVRLTLDFRAGGINAWTPSGVISGTNDWKLYQIGPVVVETDRTADVKLENYNGASGTAWFDDVTLVQVLPQPVDAFLLYPNYRGMLFDDQPQTIRLDVAVTPPAGDFGRHSVKAVLTDEASGQAVGQQSYPAVPQLIATLDGSAMQSGRSYLVTISLVDLSTNGIVSSYPAYRVSKVAGSARQSMNVSFDAKNRVLLKGVPRFVLGVYDSGLGYSADPAFWENTLWSPTGARRMNGLSINMYINYWYGQAPTGAMSALMANLQQHGVAYLQTGNCFDKFPADATFPINSSDAYVQTIGAHAGSAGYYTIDECQSSLQPAAFAQYQRLRQLDPDSMTFAALFGDPQISLWRDTADILSSDPYPLFGAEPAGGYNFGQVADWTARTRAAVKNARPFMTVLQFFKFTSQGRFPTLAEMRSMAYMAIVEGAGGLWWWSLGSNALQDVCSGWCAEKTAHMNNLKSVINEVAALEPVLLSDDLPVALVANSNAAAIRTKVKVVGGKGYVFAYNSTAAQQSASFTWNTPPGTVSVNAEGRTLTAAGAVFTDTFAPFQAHVYVVANGGATGASPLTVGFTSPSADATVSATAPVSVTANGGSGTGYTYTITVDGGTISTGTASSVAWDTTTASNGVHTLGVTVRDSAGATATSSQVVTVSNASPPPPPPPALNVAITQPTAGTTVSATAWLVVWLEGASGSSNTFTLTLGGVGLGSTVSSSAGPVSIPYDTAVVADGTHTLAVSATDSTGKSGAGSVQVVVNNSVPPALALSYNGKIRDRVGQSNTGLSADGAPDGTLTATLTATGGRTVTGLRLDSTGPGTWDTTASTAHWALGVAVSLDGPLVNNTATMAVNFAVPDGGHFTVFASDYANIEFAPGATLTLRATFSDGTTATATTTVATPVPAPPLPSSATLSLAYTGKSRDRVGQGNVALTPDGAPDGTLTLTLSGSGGRTVTGLRLESSGPGTWDTDASSAHWALGVAVSLDGPLVNSLATMAVNFAVPDGGRFTLFASDYANIEFVPGATLTVRATFSDGTTATVTTMVGSVAPSPTSPAALGVTYNGKLRDRVGQGNTALSGDGALDGTLTVTLNASGGRTVTGLRMDSTGPGTWDTQSGSAHWALGVASSLDGALVNQSTTAAVNLAVANGGSFILFASDYANIEFVPGATLTVSAAFSDGTTATAATVIP